MNPNYVSRFPGIYEIEKLPSGGFAMHIYLLTRCGGYSTFRTIVNPVVGQIFEIMRRFALSPVSNKDGLFVHNYIFKGGRQSWKRK